MYPSVDFIFDSCDILNPQQFCPSKGHFIVNLRCVSVWTHEHWPTNGFVYWLSIFDASEQLSQKRGTVDTPICTGTYLWSPFSIMIMQDSHKTMYVETTKNLLKKSNLKSVSWPKGHVPTFFGRTSVVKRRMSLESDVRQCRWPETLIVETELFFTRTT